MEIYGTLKWRIVINHWIPPPPSMVKVNVNGTFKHQTGNIGAGWIIRDEKGTYLLSGSSKLKQGSNSLEAKGIALLHALQSNWCRGYRMIIMDGDCTVLNGLLHKRSKHTAMENLLVDIRSWADHFTNISFTVVPRDCNQVADKLAKLAQHQQLVTQTNFYPPLCLKICLFKDYVNFSN